MPPDDADDRAAPVAPDAVARTTFPTSFRGYDPDHVRVFLENIADAMREARDREAALRTEVEAAQARAEAATHPTEAQLTAALGEETARVLLAAREASTEIRAKGEESVARLLREAQDDASRMKREAETILVRRTQEAEEAAAAILTAAQAAAVVATAEAEAALVELLAASDAAKEAARNEVKAIKAGAAAQAEGILEAARTEGKEMVDEALLVRTRVLDDLSRKRKAARVQLERLQAGRERLVESYEIVRRTLDEATAELKGSLTAAKRAADAAARRVEAEPAATVEQLEAEVEAARDAGLPLVEEESEPETEFTDLPEGEMVAIEPSAPFEEVRVLPEPEPEPAVVDVVAAVDVVEVVQVIEGADEVVVVVDEVVVVEELDDAETEAVDVDDLFARIRAARATEVAKAHEVLAQDATPAPAPSDTEAKKFTAAPVAPDDQALLERRDAATDAAEQKATRKLKRVLADEQNEV
ncbi:MAG: hypothetical protein QOC92_531, partial [Acidimicrobiaceae bacterium]